MADEEYTIDPKNMSLLDGIRTVAGHVGAGIADIPATVPRIYDLFSKATALVPAAAFPIFGPFASVNFARDENGLLPGQAALNKWGDSWTEDALKFGSDIAGRKIVTGTPWSNDPDITTADMIGSAASVLTNLIPITGGPARLLTSAASNLQTGIKLVDNAASAVVKAASFASPLAITNAPKTAVAINATLGGAGLAVGDVIGNNERTKNAQVAAENKLYTEQMDGANAVAQNQIKDGVDKSVNAVGETIALPQGIGVCCTPLINAEP